MNDTNRALNRIVVIVFGLLLLAGGGTVATAALWPAAGEVYSDVAHGAIAWTQDAYGALVINGSSVSGVSLIALAAALVIVVLLIIALTRIGGGRTHTVLRAASTEGAHGRIVVRDAFVSDALTQTLDGRDEILSVHIRAAEVRDERVLHVSLTPRRNTSPRRLLDEVDVLLTNLARVTGRELPTYVSVHTGLRAALARDRSRLG